MLSKAWGTCGLDGQVTLAVYGLSRFITRSIQYFNEADMLRNETFHF